MQRLHATRGIGEGLVEVFILAGISVGLTIVVHIDAAAFGTGIARSAAAIEASLDVHVGWGAFVGCLGIVAFTIDIDVGIAFDGRRAKLSTRELAKVATSPDVVNDIQVARAIPDFIVVAKARSAVGGIENRLFTDEDIHRAKGRAEIASGIHLIVDLACTDVDDRNGSVFRGARIAHHQSIVGIARTAIDAAENAAAHDVDRMPTCQIDRSGSAIGTTKHVAAHIAAFHVDLYVTRGLT